MKKLLPYLALILFAGSILIFSKPFILNGLLPIPSDTIIGLYHPFRDLYAEQYPNGIPYKNFLITDPVRQTYIWKNLGISLLQSGQMPVWNPYEMSGKPLLANFQSSPFYPLNILLFIGSFPTMWSIFILLQPLLGGLFMYWYLRNFKLHQLASLMGALSFAFSGFFVAWLEWGNVVHTALWLPLILLSIEKIVSLIQERAKGKAQNVKQKLKVKNIYIWSGVYVFAFASSLFAGHIQIFFYSIVFSILYFIARWWQFGKNKKLLGLFVALNLTFLLITAIQWIPTLQFISQSARDLDQSYLTQEGWFIPWQHLIQFFAPDFFGNPTTLNYWGTWNYGELVGYIGIIPFVFAVFALLSRLGKKTFFFGLALLISLLFALPTPLARLPFDLNIPLLSTSQPTRLLFISIFSLSTLAAFGMDYFMVKHLENNRRDILTKLIFSVMIVGAVLFGLWVFVMLGNKFFTVDPDWNLLVSRKNLVIPTGVFGLGAIFIIATFLKPLKKYRLILFTIIILITMGDLLRFANKFTPFTPSQYLFPDTRAIEYLQQQDGVFRIATLDSRILPPNFATHYKLQSVAGYDPLYLKSYAEYIAAMERGKADINPPFGYNRIIEPKNYDSPLFDLLNIRYVLSLNDIDSPKLTKVFEEGQTKIYEYQDFMPRTFFVDSVIQTKTPVEAAQQLYKQNLRTTAVVEGNFDVPENIETGNATITKYSENEIIIETTNGGNGFLVLSDVYYPNWTAEVDGADVTIYKTNLTFRGIFVKPGNHTIKLRPHTF